MKVCRVCGGSLDGRRQGIKYCAAPCRAEASRLRAILNGDSAAPYRSLAERFEAQCVEQKARGGDDQLHIWNATSMFDVARLLGDALREVKGRDGPYMEQHNIDASANFILGGQIHGEAPRLFEVYSEGNFIEATPDTCYFQIGESKYGKPVIDRVVHRGTSLLDATKCTIVSFDSTMRSNISVGLPIDLLVYETGSLKVALQRRIQEFDPYFQMVHHQWGEGLRRVFAQLPDPDWL